MASDLKLVEYVCGQMASAGFIRFKKMFGEFAIYCDEKVVALICDNQVFVKMTPEGRAMLATPQEGPPYPGAKPHFIVDEYLDQPEFLSALVAATAVSLPSPKPKSKKKQSRTPPAPLQG